MAKKYKCLVPCKIDHNWTVAGQIIDLEDNDVIEHLLNCDAIVETTETVSLTPEQILMEVRVIDRKIATLLVDEGITTLAKLAAYSEELLSKIPGITDKVAKKIYKSLK